MRLKIGFSPCPNDTFIFDAMVHGKIDTGDYIFEPVLEDVQTLNEWALEGGKLPVTKLSFPAFFPSLDKYLLLDSGAALGMGVGPLLIGASSEAFTEENVARKKIWIPGSNTTANMLFSYAYPNAKNKSFIVFSEIEDILLQNPNDLGVIIHENRFTYQRRGLHKIKDLGTNWEEKTGSPAPLGGIVADRSLPKQVIADLKRMIKESILFAFNNYPELPEFVTSNAREMEEDVMRSHINLYVNDFSRSLGDAGKNAVQKMFDIYCTINEKEAREIKVI